MQMIDTNILKTKLASRRLSWGREIEKIRFSTYDEILKIVLKQHALIKNILICFYILNISKINNIKLISTRSLHHAAQKCRKSRADSKNSQKIESALERRDFIKSRTKRRFWDQWPISFKLGPFKMLSYAFFKIA